MPPVLRAKAAGVHAMVQLAQIQPPEVAVQGLIVHRAAEASVPVQGLSAAMVQPVQVAQ